MKTTVSIIFNTQNRAWVNIWKKWWWILKFKAYNEMKVAKCRLKHNVPNIQVGKLLVQTLTNICYSPGEICMRPVKCYISREKSGQTVEMTNVGRAMSRTVRSDTSLHSRSEDACHHNLYLKHIFLILRVSTLHIIIIFENKYDA